MSFLAPLFGASSSCTFRHGITSIQRPFAPAQLVGCMASARFKSRSSMPVAKPASSPDKSILKRGASGQRAPANKASKSPDPSHKLAKPWTVASVKSTSTVATKSPRSIKSSGSQQNKDPNHEKSLAGAESAAHAQAEFHEFQTQATPWYAVVTIVVSLYCAYAYVEVKFPSELGTQDSDRAKLPQDWLLTPTLIFEGVKAVWNELNPETMGVIATIWALGLGPFPGLPSAAWKYDGGPMPYSSKYSWPLVTLKAGLLTLFLPGVFRYFDDSLAHCSAFMFGVMSVTRSLSHSALRSILRNREVWQSRRRSPFEFAINCYGGAMPRLGTNSIIAATFGVYTVVYADEKLWTPQSLVFRLDSWMHAVLFAASQALGVVMGPAVYRYAHLTNLVAFLLGRAYASFNIKNHVWIPLVSEISGAQD